MTASESQDVTRRIAAFVADAAFGAIPHDAVEAAKRCILDGAGVALAGSREPCAEILRRYAASIGGAPEAATLGVGSLRAPAHLAALVNGTAGHALDWDDTALSLESDRSVLLHPTMPPLAACLALSELSGASGRLFLTAFILGFEVEVKIAEAIHPDHFAGGRGFHSSGTIGVFGAATAASKMLGLDAPQILNALAIAATMASGVGANHGTMAKPLNMGLAAERGVMAARMARLGFDGNPRALEAGRGFFEAFGGGFDASKIVGRLGAPYAILSPGASVKPYPSGVVGHPGMDALRTLVEEQDIRAADVAEVIVRTGENTIAPGPLRIAHATTALEAKFCVPFQMAAILLRRRAGLAEFSDDFVRSEPCQNLQKKVRTLTDPEIVALGRDRVVFDITVVANDGATHRAQSERHYRGGPENPLTWADISEKFRGCADLAISPARRDAFIETVRRIDDLPQVGGLNAMLCDAP